MNIQNPLIDPDLDFGIDLSIFPDGKKCQKVGDDSDQSSDDEDEAVETPQWFSKPLSELKTPEQRREFGLTEPLATDDTTPLYCMAAG